ncbi:MAG: hypothetical protein WCY27_00650 [archaeon]|jgi:hypothetical protein|nr:hypothetical protein [archaeon]MDD2477378.1 hypothetical protein [Candidatus ainarchaeum sp.]MDD3084509.1 hypothetical protein [Candidatus ainarchaeum sp.]MDD4220790.1 hypothetical protein [Candidatus ainarchaeum sp.]MDD4662289.1 hypothetical protein [Candidatus ainarchaeum sp.]
MSKIITESNNLFDGLSELVGKAIVGLLISFFLPITTRFIEYTLNITWVDNYYFTISITIIINVLYIFKNYRQSNLFYIAGWVIGISVLLMLNIIDGFKAFVYILIPIIIILIKNIFNRKN